MSLGTRPASLELMDRRAFLACCQYVGRNFELNSAECVAIVAYEEETADDAVARLLEAVELVKEYTASSPVIARDDAGDDDIWAVRKALAKVDHLHGSVEYVGEDIVVPYADMPSFIERLGEIASRHDGVMITNSGHAADGNLHTTIHRMPKLDARLWRKTLRNLKDEIYAEMARAGGKLSGEHGIGSKRVDDFSRIADPAEMKLLVAVKKSLDPNGIMNPGTIFPIDES
jgi:glycolate oxidase